MIKKQIPESDLKLLVEALRNSIAPPLEFQAVYEAVMSSYSIQFRLFKALTSRQKAFVDVRINRKLKRISLNFAVLPEFAINELLESVKTEQTLSVQVEKTELVQVEPEKILQVSQNEFEVKRKGRGKAKKQTPPRSLVSVLIDDKDIQLLNDLAIKHDSNVSRLVRLAVRRLLERG